LSNEEDKGIANRINTSQAQIVWVGLGSPKQDIWMAVHRAQLNAPVLIGVGAAFDFFAGRIRQAPHWIQRSGLEWLYRLISEPSRLWRRYLIYNPKFIFLFFQQWGRLKRFD
jgi:N-acetylglucosaminyldiphosphoundecaprenol N-acetyl-beta-D-mannosaminyltransferase